MQVTRLSVLASLAMLVGALFLVSPPTAYATESFTDTTIEYVDGGFLHDMDLAPDEIVRATGADGASTDTRSPATLKPEYLLSFQTDGHSIVRYPLRC